MQQIVIKYGDWRDGPIFMSTWCSCRGPRFSTCYSHDCLQLSITLVPGDPVCSSDLHGHQALTKCSYMHAGNALKCIK